MVEKKILFDYAKNYVRSTIHESLNIGHNEVLHPQYYYSRGGF